MDRIFGFAAAVALVWASVAGAKQPDPDFYGKKATWVETLVAAREAISKGEATVVNRPPVNGAGEQWTPWYFAGPYQKAGVSGFGEAFGPEKGVDLVKGDGERKWEVKPEWEDGIVYTLTVPDNAAVYLYRTVTVAAPKVITGYFGSDDGMVFWLNGKKLISKDVPRGPAANQDEAKLELKAGKNELLFKVYNQSGGCGFYFSTSPTPKGVEAKDPVRDTLWGLLARDFGDAQSLRQMAWERQDGIWSAQWMAGDLSPVAQRYAAATRGAYLSKAKDMAAAKTLAEMEPLRKLYFRSREIDEAAARWRTTNSQSLRLAIEDLIRTYGEKYPKGAEYLKRAQEMERRIADATAEKALDGEKFAELIRQYDALRQEALLANPLLGFEKLLVVQRNPKQMGLPQNWQGNCSLPRTGYDNQIAVLSPVSPAGKLSTLYRPAGGSFVGDVDLNFDADKMLFSMSGSNNRWQVFEMKADGSGLRQVTPEPGEPDCDNYDPCYLPDGKIMFASSAAMHGVPCVGGADHVANLFRMNADGTGIRQLTFDQDHDWCPTVLNDGRLLYTRWEYSDTPHYFSRILFQMNPDGTNQREFYGSNSYWPNSMFYARPIPGTGNKVVAIVSGHHGSARMGEMVVLDADKARFEASGAVQRIPGYGKAVEPKIADTLVDGSWPKFLHPYPLSEKYFLASCQLTPQSNWAVCLVDVFDNIVPVCEVPGYAMLEPVPLRKTVRPPAIPDRVKLDSREGTVYLSDIYQGEAMKGVPRGTVKKLRLYEPHYAYPGMGGHIDMAVDGPWDGRRIIGTVPVSEDGSAAFVVPANTPLAMQPLDAQGRAVQVMRSWFVAMPGESISCVGCHEQQSTSPGAGASAAMRRTPVAIEPWRGPARGFSFKREVQPVLDKYCVGCHDGTQQAKIDPAVAAANRPIRDADRPDFVAGAIPDFSAKAKNGWRNFTPSYLALHPFVRRPGPESDYHVQAPYEWHASTSELVQMLKKGHYNVKMDEEAWDRLYTWIDLNVPDHGTWGEHLGRDISKIAKRRAELRTKYANNPTEPEVIVEVKREPVAFVKPQAMAPVAAAAVECPGWPFDGAETKRRQTSLRMPPEIKLPMGDGASMTLALVPAGEFVMGDAAGEADERPMARVKIERPFYMGKFEVTNAEYAAFDPLHDSGVISTLNKDHSDPGETANRPQQPVIRVSWKEAVAFCNWLSARSGKRIMLPTEAQWEYACRAGTNTPLYFGTTQTDFGRFANLADERVNNLARGDSPRWIPSAATVNDGSIVSDNVGKYPANPFGLCEMHGNVAEWTRSVYQAYPYADEDGRNNLAAEGARVVRGGSWYDRPARCRSAFRLSYLPHQKVFNVGFRVICEADAVAQDSHGTSSQQLAAESAGRR